MSALLLPTTDADVAAIARDMRPDERLEADILHGGARQALEHARANSEWTLTLWQDDTPFAIAGLGFAPDRQSAHPWLAGATWLPRCARALAVLTPHLLARMRQDSPRLWNVVHCDNIVSIRWLKRIGFSMGGERKIAGHRFRVFYMGR